MVSSVSAPALSQHHEGRFRSLRAPMTGSGSNCARCPLHIAKDSPSSDAPLKLPPPISPPCSSSLSSNALPPRNSMSSQHGSCSTFATALRDSSTPEIKLRAVSSIIRSADEDGGAKRHYARPRSVQHHRMRKPVGRRLASAGSEAQEPQGLWPMSELRRRECGADFVSLGCDCSSSDSPSSRGLGAQQSICGVYSYSGVLAHHRVVLSPPLLPVSNLPTSPLLPTRSLVNSPLLMTGCFEESSCSRESP